MKTATLTASLTAPLSKTVMMLLLGGALLGLGADTIGPQPIRRGHPVTAINAPATSLAATPGAANAPAPKPASKPASTLGPVHTIQLPNGPLITVTSTNTFTSTELRRWLRDAMMSTR